MRNTRNKGFFGCLLISLLMIPSVIIYAQNSWYLSQENGSDSADGKSPSTALQSLEHILAAHLLLPGDTLFLIGTFVNPSYKPGYSFSGDIDDPQIWHQENTLKIDGLNGHKDAYITLKAFDSNTRLLGDGANILRITNASWLRIEGLDIHGEVESIPLETARALQFLYREAGSNQSKYRVPPGTPDDEVRQLVLPVLSDISRPSYTDTRGMYLSDVHHIDILNNHIHHVPGNGLRVAGCDYIRIIGNEVDNTSRKSYSGTHGFVVTKATSLDNFDGHKILILKNSVHHNYNEIYSWAPTKSFINPQIDEGKGISMQRNTLEGGWKRGRFLIANNLSYWNGYSGIHSNSGTRMDIINNTCYMNSYTGTITNADTGGSGNNIGISTQDGSDFSIINNIVFIDNAWGGSPVSAGDSDGLTVTDNLVFGVRGSLNWDPDVPFVNGSVYVEDPQFMDADQFNFSLAPGSPAIGKANIAQALSDDFFGLTRDSAPDLGAIEYFNPEGLLVTLTDSPDFKAFPNPFQDKLTIQLEEGVSPVIWLSGLNGNSYPVNPIYRGENKWICELNFLPPGIYLLTVNEVSKIMVKHPSK